MREQVWFESMRDQWRPAPVRLLLVGESAPDFSGDQRRFFYAPTVSQYDNLFRGVIEALYGHSGLRKGEDRAPWLERLRTDGVYLIDLVPYPVNGLTAQDRRRARQDHVDSCVAAIDRLAPDGVVICHAPTFRELREPLRRTGARLLHDQPIPFPLGNQRARFVAAVRAAVRDFAPTWGE